jgi:hypothetical protein
LRLGAISWWTVFTRDIFAGECRRENCDSAKKQYGNRCGADIESDSGFHWLYLFLRKFLACVAKKVVKSLAPIAD